MASTYELFLMTQVSRYPQLIQTQTLGSPQTNAFFSVSAAYTRLTLYWQARLSASGQTDVLMQVDSTTGNNYLWAKVEAANGTAAGSHSATATTAIKIGVASGDTANYTGGGKQEIEGWSNTSMFLSSSGHYSNFDAVGTDWSGAAGGTFLVVGPHAAVKIFASAGSFATGSTFSLYGSY